MLAYDDMEGFLKTCKHLKVKLFKPSEITFEGSEEPAERYELNDFQLLCKNCYKCFRDEKSHKKHVWACTRSRGYQCRYCDKAYRFKQEHEVHELGHTGNTFLCKHEECKDKSFKTKKNLQRHIQLVHDKVRVSCPDCEYSTCNKLDLRQHQADRHGHDAPHSCSYCTRGFVSRSFLNSHIKSLHLKTSDQEVSKKRGPQGPRGHHRLKADMPPPIETTENGETRYGCGVEGCNLKPVRKLLSLKNHHLVVHLGKRFQCDLCDKTYTGPTMLKWHKSNHHGVEKKFRCDICPDRFFVFQSMLKTHMKNRHTEEGIAKEREKSRIRDMKRRKKNETEK